MPNTQMKSQAGFSLLELMVVVAVLTIVMGAVMTQIDTVQKRYAAEEQGLEIAQESREFFDQMTRDLRQAGYPNKNMYGDGILMVPPERDSRNAVGLVKFAYDEIWFEGDIDGDGQVDVVDYKLQTDAVTGKCPCRVSRSVVSPKANATDPTAQISNNYSTELQDVVNSNNVYAIDGTTTFSGVAQSNDTLYAGFKGAKLFQAFDQNGTEIGPITFANDLPTMKAMKAIRTIKINVNLLARQADMKTKMRPAVTLSASVRIPSN